MSPDDLQALVLFRDSNLILLNKPAGLAVHGGPKTPVHLEDMLGGLCFNLSHPPKLAHRLDRDTAGCLILARHDKALTRLGRLFSAGAVAKTYWAVVEGGPDGDEGRVDMALRKISSAEDGWRMIGDPAGSAAATQWKVMGRGKGLCWLELKPETGRTHQIRVHCASGLGSPIIGDPVYGKSGPMLHLLSHAVAIPYWADREPIRVEAPPPDHMLEALKACGWK
jgi:RluA family pseudouridine synthase